MKNIEALEDYYLKILIHELGSLKVLYSNVKGLVNGKIIERQAVYGLEDEIRHKYKEVQERWLALVEGGFCEE